MRKRELRAMRERAAVIAENTIGQGIAGSSERLFANWAYDLAGGDVPSLLMEIDRLRGLIAWLYHKCGIRPAEVDMEKITEISDLLDELNDPKYLKSA